MRLIDIQVDEVSLVDKAANKRTFVMTKKQEDVIDKKAPKETPADNQKQVCPNCKMEMSDAAKFCKDCGTKLPVKKADEKVEEKKEEVKTETYTPTPEDMKILEAVMKDVKELKASL